MEIVPRREALADFLRTRRARLRPADVGLPPGKRRRAPGLRREEVAELANIGVSWYTALEQGRDINPSHRVLEHLAAALRLTPAERQHLFLLARKPENGESSEKEETVSPAMRQVVTALDPHPAYVMGRRWDLLIWNRATEVVFPNLTGDYPPHPRNVVWYFFANSSLRTLYQDWDESARAVIAQFRADSARYPGDPAFTTLIADLHRVLPEFGGWWSAHDVRPLGDGHKILKHPTLGTLEFDHITMQAPTDADLKLRIFAAHPATAATLAAALGTFRP